MAENASRTAILYRDIIVVPCAFIREFVERFTDPEESIVWSIFSEGGGVSLVANLPGVWTGYDFIERVSIECLLQKTELYFSGVLSDSFPSRALQLDTENEVEISETGLTLCTADGLKPFTGFRPCSEDLSLGDCPEVFSCKHGIIIKAPCGTNNLEDLAKSIKKGYRIKQMKKKIVQGVPDDTVEVKRPEKRIRVSSNPPKKVEDNNQDVTDAVPGGDSPKSPEVPWKQSEQELRKAKESKQLIEESRFGAMNSEEETSTQTEQETCMSNSEEKFEEIESKIGEILSLLDEVKQANEQAESPPRIPESQAERVKLLQDLSASLSES